MVNFGFIGLGVIANDYLGLISDGKVKGLNVTSICAHSEESVKRAVDKFPVLKNAKCYTDYTAMLNDEDLDAVMVCTPHGQHPAMTLQALKKGKHVLCEKPAGIHFSEIDSVKEYLTDHPELKCGIMYNRRKSKAYRKIKEFMQEGLIGELVRATWTITNLYRTDAYYCSSPWRGKWKTEGGGILMTQASHQLDLFQWICGMPISVISRCSTIDRDIQVENEAEMFFEFANGAHGHFIASAHESPGINRLEICGTKGRIVISEDSEVEILRFSQDEREFAKECPDSFTKVPYSSEHLEFDDSDNKIQQAAMLENFADAIEKGEALACPYEEGTHSLEMIQATYLSSWKAKNCEIPVNRKEFEEEYSAVCKRYEE